MQNNNKKLLLEFLNNDWLRLLSFEIKWQFVQEKNLFGQNHLYIWDPQRKQYILSPSCCFLWTCPLKDLLSLFPQNSCFGQNKGNWILQYFCQKQCKSDIKRRKSAEKWPKKDPFCPNKSPKETFVGQSLALSLQLLALSLQLLATVTHTGNILEKNGLFKTIFWPFLVQFPAKEMNALEMV